MRTYRVRIEIDVDAVDARDAAEHAWELLVPAEQITAEVRPDNRGPWESVTIGEPADAEPDADFVRAYGPHARKA